MKLIDRYKKIMYYNQLESVSLKSSLDENAVVRPLLEVAGYVSVVETSRRGRKREAKSVSK